MKLNQIREYSKKSLKGRRAEAFMISLCIPAVIVFFRLIELCTASVILDIYDLNQMTLFYGSEIMWTIFDIICVFFKTILLSGIMAMVIKYFSSTLVFHPDTQCSHPWIQTCKQFLFPPHLGHDL